MKILPRVLSGAAAAGAACAAGGVLTVSIAFAIYAYAKTYVSPAAAAALTALAFAVVLGIALAVAAASARGKTSKKADVEPPSLVGRVMEVARERPLIAAAGAIAAGLLALRNPTLVATVLAMVNQPTRPRRH